MGRNQEFEVGDSKEKRINAEDRINSVGNFVDEIDKIKDFESGISLEEKDKGMDVIAKVALNKGMSNYVFIVYRHAIATTVIAPFAWAFERKKERTKMNVRTMLKIALMSLLGPVVSQNLY